MLSILKNRWRFDLELMLLIILRNWLRKPECPIRTLSTYTYKIALILKRNWDWSGLPNRSAPADPEAWQGLGEKQILPQLIVEWALFQADEKFERCYELKRQEYNLDRIAERVTKIYEIQPR